MNIVPQLIINSLIAGSIYSLVALGFNLIYGATRFFNLAHGIMAASGGYVVFFGVKTLGWNLYISIILSVFVVGCIGYLLDRFIYKPLRRKKSSNMVMLVASLGVFSTIQALLAILFSTQFHSLRAISPEQTFNLFGGIITQTQIIIILVSLISTISLHLFLSRTRFGKAVKAVSDDEEVSRIVGINTDRIIGATFFIGSSIAALAGILVGLDTGIEPTIGMSLLLKGVVAAIIGGIGNIFGGTLGAFLLGFVENFSVWKISSDWKEAITFTLLVSFLIFRPQGLMNKRK